MTTTEMRKRNEDRHHVICNNEKHIKSVINRTINELYIHIVNGKSIESFIDSLSPENRLSYILYAIYRLCTTEEMNNARARFFFDKKMTHRLQFVELLKDSVERIHEAYRVYDSFCNVPYEIYSDTSDEFSRFAESWYNSCLRFGRTNDFVDESLMEAICSPECCGVSHVVVSRMRACLYILRSFTRSKYYGRQKRHEYNIIGTDRTKEFILQRADEIFLTIDTALL